MWDDKYSLTNAVVTDIQMFETAYKSDKILLPEVEKYIQHFPSLALKYNSKILALGGFINNNNTVFTSWNIVSKDAKKYKIITFKGLVKGFNILKNEILKTYPKVKRLQAIVNLNRPEAIKLNKILDYEPEAILRNFDHYGNHYLIMSKIINNSKGPVL